MPYTVEITESFYTTVSFETKEEAEAFMKDPNYDLIDSWECEDQEMKLLGEN